jgi:hypothetical protein
VIARTTGREISVERRRSNRAWYWLLLVPLIGLLVPPIYNHTDPELIGIPFFYWYQLAWIPLSVAVTWLVYVKTTERRSQ